jgi:hypothetical protein
VPYAPYKGATILAPYNEVPHLFVVMNDPCKDGLCLLVMVTSIKPNKHYYSACILDVGDHPFLRHPSHVLYRMAEPVRMTHIVKMVDLHYYTPKDDLDASIFSRVAGGVYASDDTPLRIIRYAKANGI